MTRVLYSKTFLVTYTFFYYIYFYKNVFIYVRESDWRYLVLFSDECINSKSLKQVKKISVYGVNLLN